MLNHIKKIWSDTVAEMKKSERFYTLDDTRAVAVKIDLDLYDLTDLKANVHIYERYEDKRGDSVEAGWDCIDLDSVPARVLGQVVEIKMNVERWNKNELDDLPPSTSPDFLAEDEARRVASRNARRRRRIG